MYIEKVVLENFRGFAGNHEITLHPELTVFAGVNGSGKSAVLDAIGSLMSSTVSWIQGGTHSWFAGGEPRNIHAGADIADWGLIYREGGTGKHASLRLGAYLHPPSGTWKPPTTFGFLDQYRQATESILLPMLSYIHSSSTRLPVRHKERSADLTGRALAYRGAFDSEAHQFIDLETWYEQEENIENEEKNRLSSFRFELSTLKAVRGALMRGIGALHV